jgi:hypothetical protein
MCFENSRPPPFMQEFAWRNVKQVGRAAGFHLPVARCLACVSRVRGMPFLRAGFVLWHGGGASLAFRKHRGMAVRRGVAVARRSHPASIAAGFPAPTAAAEITSA